MGQFCLPVGDTKEAAVRAAIGNLELWLKALGGPYENDEYLLGFAEVCLEEAFKREKIKNT